jgi:hypothetical protein
MSGVVVVDGVQYWLTTYACAQLGVARGRLADWVRRSKQAGHVPVEPGRDPAEVCPRCASCAGGFPHVDPPIRRGRVAGYAAEQLMEAEAYTATTTRGGVSRTVA